MHTNEHTARSPTLVWVLTVVVVPATGLAREKTGCSPPHHTIMHRTAIQTGGHTRMVVDATAVPAPRQLWHSLPPARSRTRTGTQATRRSDTHAGTHADVPIQTCANTCSRTHKQAPTMETLQIFYSNADMLTPGRTGHTNKALQSDPERHATHTCTHIQGTYAITCCCERVASALRAVLSCDFHSSTCPAYHDALENTSAASTA
jgi:hypothetical protein